MVNGCGTTYYGKKNIQTRPGPCPHCGHAVELKSYETRKWFVIVLIPIIPLGRLRIIDYCSVCTRHFMMESDKWETSKQLEVSGAQEKYRTNPTPEAAIDAHQQMMNYHQLEDAAVFRKVMREKYPDNAKVHSYLGAVMERFGQSDEATASYTRAFELRPDMPDARIGVARGYIRSGKLAEARALLDFMEKPGAAQLYSLEPLDTLAREYQKAERHEDALALFAIIQKELPHMNDQGWFRELIKKSEKALKRAESQIPKKKFSWKEIFAAGNPSNARTILGIGIILGLVALGMVISNEFIRRHRTLHIVSNFSKYATVKISGGGEFNNIKGKDEMTLKEGRYHASISGPISQEVDFEISSGYWARWFRDPAWVLNLGGESILTLVHAHYSANDPQPPDYHFLYGETFISLPEVNHLFTELPKSVSVDRGETRTLVNLKLFEPGPYVLFYYFTRENRMADAFKLAEWRLRLHPEDDSMLAQYFSTAKKSDQIDRLEKFLRTGLTNRPVLIQWHRFYQNLHQNKRNDAALLAEYADALKQEPTNSALMYLMGRVVTTRAESRLWFERASQTDTNNAFAYYAIAGDHMGHGDWPVARELLERACKLRPEQEEFQRQLTTARFATGDFAALEKEFRAEIKANSLDLYSYEKLCDALVAQNHIPDAEIIAKSYEVNARSSGRGALSANARDVHRHILEVTGNFAELEKETAAATDPQSRYLHLTAMLCLGRVEEAIKQHPADENTANDVYYYLNIAIAFRAAGNNVEAKHWFDLGLAAMDKGDADMTMLATLLRRTSSPTLTDTDELSQTAEAKTSVLVTLAQLHTASASEYLPRIEKLNVEPGYQQQLLKQAILKLK